MAQTATMMRPKQATGQWSSIFPNEVLTEQQSALFVKKLLAVAVSNITYLRAIFPEHAFGDRCIEDLNLKILKDDSSCPGSCQVIKWVKGCFDALEKKYLRMVIIGIYVDEDNPDNVIESYSFKFSYKNNTGIDIYRNDKKISSAYTAEDTKKATIRLLRTVIVLTQTLKSLPDDVWMTMKLLYYDDVTPAEYEPPGFTASKMDTFVFDEEPANINVGDVNTNFHTVKIRIKTAKSQFEMEEEDENAVDQEVNPENGVVADDVTICENEVVENEVTHGLDEEEPSPKVGDSMVPSMPKADVYTFHDEAQPLSQPMSLPMSQPHGQVPLESPAVPNTNEKAVSQSGQSSNIPDQSEAYTVKCPCGYNEDDGLMILCEVCKMWQHGVCFCITVEEEAPVNHVCNECAQAQDMLNKATDPYLNGLSMISAQALCLWRRALLVCLETKAILAPTFARRLGVEVTVAQGLMNRLNKEGYIRSNNKGKKHGKIVNVDKIRGDGIAKYFHTKTQVDAEMVDVENVDTTETKDKELDKLSKKTEEMAIVKPKGKGRSKGKGKNTQSDQVITELKSGQNNKDWADVHADENRRGKKRAISKLNDGQGFDISNSQDIDGEGDRSRTKKASISANSIMV